jgi:hypothetical protein
VSLFDGKTLEGWKIGNNANAFSVQDGVIVMDYPAGDQALRCSKGQIQRKPLV